MEGLSTLVLLSSVVLLCSAAPALELVTCDDTVGNSSAHLAMHHINNHHEHGYKFRLLEKQNFMVEKTDTGCNMELTLSLGETECHTVNPKHFEDCKLRSNISAVIASCTVKMTVEQSDAKVNSYTCNTKKALPNQELVNFCPDCPTLIPLNDKDGLESVDLAVKEFNKNTSNANYFVLKEVGRMQDGYIPGSGMNHFCEIILQESICPMHSRIVPSACKPMCPERAQHVLCKTSHSKSNGSMHLDCEYYKAATTDPPGLEQQTTCLPGPPVNVGPPVPPGPVHPSPGELSPRPPVLPHIHHCHNSSLEFHPICDWPHQHD